MKLERIGPYRVIKRIGKGGMGAVYEAVAEGVGAGNEQRVAIKALSPQLAMAEGFRERFEAEIESLKKLKHDGIVRLLGFGEQDGVLFYSMELVDGPSLEEEINDGRRFDWRETLQIGIQICRALKHAHDHGVVHRDIKPANLMLTSDDRVKIADFGIARLFGGTQLTTAGGVLGTADYMSPEQADGRAVTEKCDQYSLGGVMYALLAGRPPFKAKTMPEMLQLQRFAEPEPVRRYAPDTPDQLDRLISQLLAKNPDQRFPNVLVLSRHMEAMEKALSRPVEPDPEDDVSTADFTPNIAGSTADMSEQSTRALDAPVVLPHETDTESGQLDLYDAPTLDQPTDMEALTKKTRGPTQHVPSTTTSTTAARSTHFTTVDEEARRKLEQSKRSRFATLGPLLGLLATLGILIWSGWRLMRPPNADELFSRIQLSAESDEIEGLSREAAKELSDELESFAQRFPQDPRNEEFNPLREQLEFQAYERQVRTRARFSKADGIKPIEAIYFDALSSFNSDPAKALIQLRALISLYDPLNKITTFGEARAAMKEFTDLGDPRLLVVAKRRIENLQAATQEIRSTQLPALQERLRKAAQLRQSNPAQAVRMYKAIIQLYGSEPWAADIVNQAKQAIAPQ